MDNNANWWWEMEFSQSDIVNGFYPYAFYYFATGLVVSLLHISESFDHTAVLSFSILQPDQHFRHFADDIFKCGFLLFKFYSNLIKIWFWMPKELY